MNDRDRYHTASPDDERAALRDLLNLLPPCPECRHRRCLPWARKWMRYFAELVQPGTGAPGMPLALPLFRLGRLLMTPGAREALCEARQVPLDFIIRHQQGDWGDCCAEDAAENELSVREGFRVFSVYRTSMGVKLYVITEADRSATTILLPEEY